MFTKSLSKNAEKGLAVLGKSRLLKDAYLAGGTACALHLGHRLSNDLDFFTQKEFDTKSLIKSIRKIGEFQLERESEGTILGIFERVKFSIFVYEYPVLFPFESFCGINILDLRDIAAMKIAAISTRGVKRDYVDLYFICQNGVSLIDALSYYDRKYGVLSSNLIHIQKSLVYFLDAEMTEMPEMIKKVDWKEVKKFFETEVKKLAKEIR